METPVLPQFFPSSCLSLASPGDQSTFISLQTKSKGFCLWLSSEYTEYTFLMLFCVCVCELNTPIYQAILLQLCLLALSKWDQSRLEAYVAFMEKGKINLKNN